MIRFKTILFICIFIIILTSCNNQPNDYEPNYKKVTNDINNSNEKRTNDTNKINNEVNDTDITSDITDWPYHLDFTGIGTANEQYLHFSNVNIKYSKKATGLICPDTNNNCFYYINYGDDNYIYQYKDDTRILLVKKESYCLQLWDNELYFLGYNKKIDNDSLMTTGDIYCYNIDTKELKLVLEANAISLYIDANGIFYQNVIDIDTLGLGGFRLDFGSVSPYRIDYTWYFSYKDYILYNTSTDIILHNNMTVEKIKLAPVTYIANNINLIGNYFIFTKGACIYVLNLLNGEQKSFDINNYEYLFSKVSYIFDYIVLDNNIYASDANRIFKINMTNGEIFEFRNTSQMTKNYESLFTDGYKIYALTKDIVSNISRLEELIFGNDLDASILSTKELGE